MKIYQLNLLVSLFLLAGCTQEAKPEHIGESDGRQIILCASTPSTEEISGKTTLDSTAVIWQSKDEISLFNKNSSHYQFTLTEGAGTTTAKFSGTIKSFVSPYYLLYPYNSKNSKKASSLVDGAYALNFTLCQTQTYVYHAFGKGSNPMYATINAPEDNIDFKNICGYLRLHITGSCKITKIEVRDLAGAMLWGDTSIALAKAGTDLQKIGLANGSDTVILDVNSAEGGLDLTGHTDYYFWFVLPPGSLAGGFEAKVYNGDSLLKTFTTTKSHTIVRNKVTVMKEVSMDKDPEPLIDEKAFFSSLPSGTSCKGLESLKDDSGFIVSFSNDSTYKLERTRSALVTIGGNNGQEMQDRCWYINGNKQNDKQFISDSPYYTVGANGNWFCDGADTKTRAVPANADADKYDIYVTSIIKMPTFIEVLFSDGSRLSYPRTDRSYEMYVEKTATELNVYIDASKPGNSTAKKWIKYPLVKRYRAYEANKYPSFYDNWGMMLPVLCSKSGNTFTKQLDLFLSGESESTLRTADGKDGTFRASGGSTHGFENIKAPDGVRAISFEVDGTKYSESSTIGLTSASKIVVTMRSEMCCAYTNSNPYVDVTKVWTFENGKLSIGITYDFTREIVASVGKFGMVCCKRLVTAGATESGYITRLAVKGNRPANVVNIEEGWSNSNLSSIDYNCSRITEYGDKGLFFALVVDTPVLRPKSGMFVATNGNNYNKIYYEAFGTESTRNTMNAGDRVQGLVHWEIEEY